MKKGQITKKTRFPIRKSGNKCVLYLSDLLEDNYRYPRVDISWWLPENITEPRTAYYGSRGAYGEIDFYVVKDVTDEEYLVWINLEASERKAYIANWKPAIVTAKLLISLRILPSKLMGRLLEEANFLQEFGTITRENWQEVMKHQILKVLDTQRHSKANLWKNMVSGAIKVEFENL